MAFDGRPIELSTSVNDWATGVPQPSHYQPTVISSSWGVEYSLNSSDNATETSTPYPSISIIFSPLVAAGIITIYTTVIVATILGNLLVVASVCVERKLQTPANILIINLAVADLAVAILVMPMVASYDLSGQWIFGQSVCNMFIFFDVICCTASIVDLCCISVDRYLAITRPFRYARYRTTKLMVGLVVLVWAISVFISVTPLFIFGNEHTERQCLLSQDPIYTIYSTFGAFYIPLFIMMVVYYKIYRAAGELEKKELQRRPSMPGLLPRGSIVARSGSVSSDSDSMAEHCRPELRRKSSIARFTDYVRSASRNSLASVQVGKNRISLRLERKASKTLGIIMGAFIVCWLPFFVLAIARVFCKCEIPQALHITLVWLGYVNSMLNPIIYPFFNKDFGPAYRRMLRVCCCRLCPESISHSTPKELTSPTARRHSFTNHHSTHAVLATELQAIAEDSHDEASENGEKPHRHDSSRNIDGIKYDSLHLDELNRNNKRKNNMNKVAATDV